ncbi:unnamed protein product [Arctogadus glacialis]
MHASNKACAPRTVEPALGMSSPSRAVRGSLCRSVNRQTDGICDYEAARSIGSHNLILNPGCHNTAPWIQAIASCHILRGLIDVLVEMELHRRPQLTFWTCVLV